ncbi:hypothetical protein [Anoxybacteroides tepidamans]|uniref:hypothetical protein n=1 Tax=Anoxybacteroides tepidamans TaxID=265948 RepID=UPI0006861347|nr:hypothetical protein [Anoxybacillus tepidamans]
MRENETSRDETAVLTSVSGEGAATRSAKRKQLVRRTYFRAFLRTAVMLAVLLFLAAALLKGLGALKREMERGAAIERFEEALKEKDMSVLKMYIRSEEVAINDRTLAPLLTYIDRHPKAYDVIHRELEGQSKEKHVYIKGLTSVPPVFTMTVYETQLSPLNQYVFKPTLYSFVIRQEEDAEVMVNGEPAQGAATKDPFVKKYGPYLPGQYEITLKTKQGNKTKTVVLFGGSRIREIKF